MACSNTFQFTSGSCGFDVVPALALSASDHSDETDMGMSGSYVSKPRSCNAARFLRKCLPSSDGDDTGPWLLRQGDRPESRDSSLQIMRGCALCADSALAGPARQRSATAMARGCKARWPAPRQGLPIQDHCHAGRASAADGPAHPLPRQRRVERVPHFTLSSGSEGTIFSGSAGILPAAGRRPEVVQAGRMPALPGDPFRAHFHGKGRYRANWSRMAM